MAAQQRRRTPAQAARLILILGANALCLFLLWKLGLPRLGARADASAPPAARVEAPVEGPAPADARSAAPDVVNARDPRLEARIEQCIRTALDKAARETKGRVQPSEVTVAVHVRELAVDGELVALRADRSLRPASNLKLVTTAAALVLLGPDWSFRTRFTSSAPIVAGRLQGDLVVRASGDPLYDPEAKGEVEELLAPALEALRAAGIAAIDGRIVLDEGSFQPPEPGPAWPTEKDAWKEYCALAGGFSANAGCLTATVAATEGTSARVVVRPRAHAFPERLSVRTVGAKQSLDVRVGALGGTVVVEGSLPRDVPEGSARFAVSDPVELFGRVLSGALRARGIAVSGGVVREHRAPAAGERELAVLETPLARVLGPINTDSNNACADQLFFALGDAIAGRGTRAGGRAATAQALERLGLDPATLVQVDGSGLSRENRNSARQITALVDAVLRRDPRTARLYLDSLAVGHASGTLDGRMRDDRLAGRVHAKTGFINGTSALSGVLDAESGRTLVFSILVEYPPQGGLNQSCWKPMQDALCGELARADG
ncbi:MAG: D-alanyl-D-alanine carboxypeptidase/D-alanyl-D-alanine-endopeptidase [Planctomycetes bacterium]|nr:D-alanyl-D-alanine carboxypeptidase/D-alanyl-D-alanine-endopeptidase [Planctomycetota bacterium]